MICIKNIVFNVPKDAAQAIAIQKDLAQKVMIKDDFAGPKIIAGLDVGYDHKRNLSKAAIALFKNDHHNPFLTAVAYAPTPFPYISGLLSFREIPVILELFKALPVMPELIFVDGQGIAHPRRLGIASHLGVLLDVATIGVGKTRLCGKFEMPDALKGSYTALMDRDEQIGLVYRSRDNVRPLFISPGHRISLETSRIYVEKYLNGLRLPEPTRLADKISKFIK